MESASSLRLKSPAPKPSTRSALLPRAGLTLLLAAWILAWMKTVPQWESRIYFALPLILVLSFCLFWNFRVCVAGLPWGWSVTFAGLLAGQLSLWAVHLQTAPVALLKALGSAVFVYILLWIFAMHERDPGLRPLATSALMMSIGILALPPVVIGCALLSLAFFLDQRRALRSTVNLLLLLFTPVVLCVLSLTILDMLSWGSIREVLRVVRLNHNNDNTWGITLHVGASLAVVGGVLLSRLIERESRPGDLALVGLLLFLGTAGRAYWMPGALSIADLSVIAYAGAASLLALSPPRALFARLAVLFSLGLGMAMFVR